MKKKEKAAGESDLFAADNPVGQRHGHSHPAMRQSKSLEVLKWRG
jgi:hypothetical protein